ncbi:MAG: hypothetical protein DHS20C21_10100 [Gemmatimonadota bacterium]|nr:MAG: hypothetical protein DHS20C21_10100 [Gemmatimonadota bacterium]
MVQGPERPHWRVFGLEPARTAAPDPGSPAVRDGRPVALVAMPESGAGYATRRIAYSRGAGELEYFAEHRWVDPPARMLVPLLQQALTATGAFSSVAALPTRVRGDFVVESEILAFRQELQEEGSRFRATLRITSIRAGTPGAVDSRIVEVLEPMERNGPTEVVAAANRATSRLLSEVASFCAEMAAREALPTSLPRSDDGP